MSSGLAFGWGGGLWLVCENFARACARTVTCQRAELPLRALLQVPRPTGSIMSTGLGGVPDPNQSQFIGLSPAERSGGKYVCNKSSHALI